LQENTAHPREILQMKINDTAEKSNRFNAKGIVHGRLRTIRKTDFLKPRIEPSISVLVDPLLSLCF